MFAVAGGPSFADNPLSWSLLFARQPEPDLEFTEEELEQTTSLRSPSPVKSPKKSGGRPFLWLLLLLLIGGGAYIAMEPEMAMDLVGPLLGESPMPPQPPPMTMKPAPPRPAPVDPSGQARPGAPPPIAPPTQTPQTQEPTTSLEATTTRSMPVAPLPSPAPVPMSPPGPAVVPPPILAVPNPLFGEGQWVILLPNPGAPQDKVTLRQDPAGTKPGAAIPPGTALRILDGDLQGDVWVYSIRSDYGTEGWVAENQLRLKP